MGKLSWIIWLYIIIIVTTAAAIVAHAPISSYSPRWWAVYGVLAALFLICDSTATPLAARQSAWSPSSAATLAAVVLLGGPGAAMVGATAALSIRRVPMAGRIYHAAACALAGYAAGAAYLAAGGHSPVAVPDLLSSLTASVEQIRVPIVFWSVLTPFTAAAVVHVLVNDGLLWAMLMFDRHNRSATRATPGFGLPLLLASDLGFAALGLVVAALWVVIGPLAAAIVLVPLLAARWAMGQFAEQRRAHSATMAALCQAVETKDVYTRGHSERVSKGAAMIAREIGMRPDRAEAVTIAGMLHDVGKLGVPTRVLRKGGRLTEEEFEAIRLHPIRGLEIVGEISFLTEALSGIMHHHERMDGRGYPMGFAGDEIPEFARVIAVADAFDSMTSDRSYRKARQINEATAELRSGAGSQFDPKMVEAFITALNREGWQPPEHSQPYAPEIGTSVDHDDPMSPPQRIVEN
jgi:hypothetical protein